MEESLSEGGDEELLMLYHLVYSTVSFIFGIAVLVKYFRNELRLGVRCVYALLVLFAGEPVCHFAIGSHLGVIIFILFCIVTYVTLPANHLEINHKAVLVTGCDSGLGLALAQYLDKRGFDVFAGILHKGGHGEVLLNASCSTRLTTLQLDVTKKDQIQQAFQTVQRKLGGQGLWGLVNNAGVFSFMDIELTPLSIYQQLLDVNCLAVVQMTKTFLPLIRKVQGRVVNISSTYGRVPLMGLSAYNISKAGVEIFTDVLRQEMKKWGIKVSLVEPYGFLTSIISRDKMDCVYHSMMDNLTPELLQLYGTSYFETYKKEIVEHEGRTLHCSESLTEDCQFLCRCVRDALLSRWPQARYPEGPGARILMLLSDHLPTAMLDLFLPHILPDWAKIKPDVSQSSSNMQY
ncbi:retinol dehydrogenase 7-like [Saccoglossus kowalevskii]|uniref:Estradiol 17-beta-dehydrogenase 2-like n=1 Tax=Saccoglossus kowalevskii TaxID=10224 RepID=A0ABM0MD90_SACKO|nr:PREDICTED: estradiol 17-beta-dehydrogenase 2-like [Saccoglossus kowalevskii]